MTPLLAPPAEAARGLLGCTLVRDGIQLRITEVEAYGGPEDSASHARHGHTPRNAPMWGPAGRAYLYLCYGIHWMLNVVTGPEGEAAAVLIRSGEVCEGAAEVLVRRGAQHLTPTLLAGPGKVAQALGLDRTFDGHTLLTPGGLELRAGEPPRQVVAGPRLGIGFALPPHQALPWRFADGDSLAVSHRKSLQAPLRNGDRPWPR